VHNAPPWFYLLHMPGTLFPWFFLAAVAVVALWRTERFLINWILAVLLPYSVMSSKLDVYMMALIPPVALLIARYVENDDGRNRARWPNVVAVALIVLASAAALFVRRPELALPGVRPFLFFAAGVSIVALLITVRGSLTASTLATGLLPVALMVYIGIALMPMVNEMTSTRPLVAALERQHVPADQIALYTTPYLWTRDMPPALEHVRYVDAGALASTQPQVVATSRAHARELAGLERYRVVDSVRMIGKWFDVYRR
jgi:4-amino-4-deoxy-L-arabinose transferase-like glycosyltransferase